MPVNVQYTYSQSLPPLQRMVPTVDSSNPLSVILTNPDLRKSDVHTLSAGVSYAKGQSSHSLGANGEIRPNDIVNGYAFDPSTGVRYYKPFNVGGSWNLTPSYALQVRFGKKKQFSLNNNVSYRYIHSEDMVGLDGESMEKNSVNNASLTDRLAVSTEVGRHTVSLTASGIWRHTSSSRDEFTPFTATDINVGVNGRISLPGELVLSTDLTLYTRNGYADAAVNRRDFVWNARLSRVFLKGKLVLMVDGFDLLHSLSSVYYSVNAQGRTETYYNTMSRYVMAHMQLRLNHQPKKLKTIGVY